jgi:uncharacterized coiled-coil DUF342 family protein
MSKVGKIFLGLTIVGALACVGLSVLVVSAKKGKEDELDQAQTKISTASSERDKAKKEAAAAVQKATEKDSEISELTTKASGLKQNLEDAQGKTRQLESDVLESKKKLVEAESEVKKVNDSLGGKTADELKKQALEAQEKLTILQREKKILDDSLAASKARVAELETYLDNAKKGIMPPGINGRVMTVNKSWNFVVLNIGQKQNVIEGGELIVYRGQKMVGKVKVVSVEANTSVADILPDWVQADLQAGDEVIN